MDDIGNLDISTITGRIHSVETCGTVDGPGVRYVIFTQGCPLRCMYCHNPDTWDLSSEKALTKSVGELMPDIKKYKSYFSSSGGGVTLTGGEPLLQKDFALALFKTCKQEKLHTCLDTSGYVNIDDTVREVLEHTDLVMLDVKSINEHTYKKTTGVAIDRLMAFAEYLNEANIPAWMQFVLVPGLTDNEDELHALAAYLSKLSNVQKVGVLPFHQLGAYKWRKLKLDYRLNNTEPPTHEETERVRELFRSYNLSVR